MSQRLCESSRLITVFALLLIGCCGCRDIQFSNVTHPVISCEDTLWDFGPIQSNETLELEHSFNLNNSSSLPVTCILKSSCGCIVAEPDITIGPRSSKDISIKVKAGGVPGVFQKTIVVSNEEKGLPFLTLELRGIILPNGRLYSFPEIVDFGVVSSQETRKVQVRRYNGSRIQVNEIKKSSDIINVVQSQPSVERDSLELLLEMDSKGIKPGKYLETLSVVTDNEGFTSLTIPVRFSVDDDVKGLVGSIVVPLLGCDEEVERELFVRGSRTRRVTKVTYSGDPDIAVELVNGTNDVPLLSIRRVAGEIEKPKVASGHALIWLEGVEDPRSINLKAALREM